MSNEVLDSGKVSTCPKLSALDSLMWIALFLFGLFGFTLSGNAQFKDFPQIPSLSGGFTGDYWNRNYHLTAVYPYHTDNFTGWIGLHSRAHRTDASENIEGYLLSEYARLRVELGYKLRSSTHIGLYSEGAGYDIVSEARNDTIGFYLRPFVRRNPARRFVLTSKLGLAMDEAHTEPMWHPLPTLNVTAIRFPEGVGLRIAGDTVFDMNSHYVNLLGTEPIIGETYVNLWTLPPEAVKYEAKGLAASNKDINVPPGTTRVVEGEWLVSNALKLLRLQGYRDVTELNVFQLTSHMHRHGELFEIFRISTGELLHKSVAYDNAPLSQLNPPLKLTVGDGLRFECTHSNYDTDQTIRYGVTSEDEMAIMFGFYYIPINNEHDR